ncbi:VCBS domain-containing protein, partial [Novosphingobium tardum]
MSDSYSYTEEYLLDHAELYDQMTEILTLDVMSNDLGGKAKTLFSIDDGIGNQITDLSQTDLLSNSINSAWQKTSLGNEIRIFNGKVQYRLVDQSGHVRDVDSLNGDEKIVDSFTYAIKLGNGTLSWAKVSVNITGTNDNATISGTATGSVIE